MLFVSTFVIGEAGILLQKYCKYSITLSSSSLFSLICLFLPLLIDYRHPSVPFNIGQIRATSQCEGFDGWSRGNVSSDTVPALYLLVFYFIKYAVVAVIRCLHCIYLFFLIKYAVVAVIRCLHCIYLFFILSNMLW